MSVGIRNCQFAYRCHRRWERLRETDDPAVRFCRACRKPVFFCRTEAELVHATALDRCVAIAFAKLLPETSQPMAPLFEIHHRRD